LENYVLILSYTNFNGLKFFVLFCATLLKPKCLLSCWVHYITEVARLSCDLGLWGSGGIRVSGLLILEIYLLFCLE